MKSRLAVLFIVLGGVLAGLNTEMFEDLSVLPLSIIGGFLISFSFMLFTSVYGGKIWGVKIKCSTKGLIKQLIGFVGLIVGGFSLVATALCSFVALTSGEFATVLGNLLGFIIPLVIGPFIAKIVLEKTLATEQSADVLGQFKIFSDIDANMAEATSFVVGFEGVALFSNTNYCYAVYLYENYQMGSLSTPQEVALVGTYFVQKYSDKYTFKVDVEVIPGEPGQTVVAVGTGGIGVARIQGTPDTRLFRSYIFTKKK